MTYTEDMIKSSALIAAAPNMYKLLKDMELAMRNGGMRKPKQWHNAIITVLLEVEGRNKT